VVILTELKRRRINMGLTTQQLAERLGVTRQYISLLENGKRKPSFDVAKSLKKVFDIAADELLVMGDV